MDIFIFRLFKKTSKPKQLQHYVSQRTVTLFEIGDFVQITNYLRDEFGIICKIIKVFDENYKVYLRR